MYALIKKLLENKLSFKFNFTKENMCPQVFFGQNDCYTVFSLSPYQ